jgi:DegV family protein with EDD domain
MRPVAIVTDSTHYVTRGLIERAGIVEVSLYVRIGKTQEREAQITDYTAFYQQLRQMSELPSTSQPSIGDFTSTYEPLLESGHDVVSIHLSTGISGTHGAAVQAKAMLEERGVDGRVEVLDSETVGGGLGLVVLAAAAAAEAGATLEEVLARARQTRAALQMWFCVDTLEYLQRGGRIGRAEAWLGGALQIKPILTFEAEVTPVERVRTAGRAFERMVDYMHSLFEDGADGWIIQHIQAREKADALVERGRELFGSEPIFVSEVGPVVGTYTGPGLIGVGGVAARLLRA